MLSMIWQAKADYQSMVLLLLVILALWRGAAPERWIAAIFVGMFVVDRIYHLVFPVDVMLAQINLGHFVIDLAAAAAMVTLALQANRVYPIIMGALQLAATISHLVIALNPSVVRVAYAILAIAPSYLQIVVFAVGLWCHIRRARQYGQYPSWQSS